MPRQAGAAALASLRRVARFELFFDESGDIFQHAQSSRPRFMSAIDLQIGWAKSSVKRGLRL
jgi:hypothetical protein